MLTSAKFDVSRIVRRTAVPGQEALHAIATDVMALMQDTIDTARSISNEMRPSVLDLLGLGAALRQALERFGMRHGIAVTVSSCGEGRPVPPAAATQIFRIVQEALTNIVRHAQARRVVLMLLHTGDGLEVCLSDDGVGIDTAEVRPDAIGLFSMAERASEIGATLRIGPAPGGGTRLLLQLPLGRDAQEEGTT
jgi:signal transduction histidine kinase